MELIIGLLIGIAIAFIVTGMMKSKMNTAVEKRAAADYIRPGSFALSVRRDRFLYENTTRTRKEKKKD